MMVSGFLLCFDATWRCPWACALERKMDETTATSRGLKNNAKILFKRIVRWVGLTWIGTEWALYLYIKLEFGSEKRGALDYLEKNLREAGADEITNNVNLTTATDIIRRRVRKSNPGVRKVGCALSKLSSSLWLAGLPDDCTTESSPLRSSSFTDDLTINAVFERNLCKFSRSSGKQSQTCMYSASTFCTGF